MGKVRITKRGNTYHARAWVHGIEHFTTLKTSDKTIANTKASTWYLSLTDGQPEIRVSMRFSEFVKRILVAQNSNEKSYNTNRIDRYVLDFASESLGRLTLNAISRRHIESALALFRQSRSQTSVNIFLRHLKSMFGHAVRQNWIKSNPCVGIKLIKVEKRLPKALTEKQVADVLRVAESRGFRFHAFFLLGIYAGLRRREIAFARWEWLDFEHRTITVQAGGAFALKDKADRCLPMHDRIYDAFAPHRRPSGFIFDSSGVKSNLRYDPKKSFHTICSSAGLPEDVTPHWLRHTFGTRLARAGVSIYKIKEWMGHSDIRVTEIYARLAGADEDINRVR